MYFAPVWWDETCAPLWRYRGQRWDPRSDAWLLHPWRQLVYLQDRQWEGPRGWGGLLGAGVGKRPLPPPLPPLTTIGQKLLGTVLASSPAVSPMFGGEWSASPARSWRQLPVPTSWGGDATPTPPTHTHTTPPLPKQPGPQGALTRCLSALYPGRCGLPLGDSGCGRAGLERAVK